MNNKPFQLRLKVVWFKNFLGLAVDQVVLNQHYSLTPYYFWPRTEAWEQLQLELDSKLWLTQADKVAILKTTGHVMDYWLSYQKTKSVQDFKKDFQEIDVTVIN
jgi:30S ribosomal protein 3|tara:strand:+ start:2270 stop:2581 length:312 start_codon:yes stop_codon:yes gene_type:complete